MFCWMTRSPICNARPHAATPAPSNTSTIANPVTLLYPPPPRPHTRRAALTLPPTRNPVTVPTTAVRYIYEPWKCPIADQKKVRTLLILLALLTVSQPLPLATLDRYLPPRLYSNREIAAAVT